MQLHDSGLTQASLYDNAGSPRFLIELKNVIVLHNFPIKTDKAAVYPSCTPRRWYSALSFSRQAPIMSETFFRCCALICFLNLTELITARTWCIYSGPSSSNVPISFFSHPPDIKAIVHRDPECGALHYLCERWVDPPATDSLESCTQVHSPQGSLFLLLACQTCAIFSGGIGKMSQF